MHIMNSKILIKLPTNYIVGEMSLHCSYWDGENLKMSTNGLRLVEVRENQMVCETTHLTDFMG